MHSHHDSHTHYTHIRSDTAHLCGSMPPRKRRLCQTTNCGKQSRISGLCARCNTTVMKKLPFGKPRKVKMDSGGRKRALCLIRHCERYARSVKSGMCVNHMNPGNRNQKKGLFKQTSLTAGLIRKRKPKLAKNNEKRKKQRIIEEEETISPRTEVRQQIEQNHYLFAMSQTLQAKLPVSPDIIPFSPGGSVVSPSLQPRAPPVMSLTEAAWKEQAIERVKTRTARNRDRVAQKNAEDAELVRLELMKSLKRKRTSLFA